MGRADDPLAGSGGPAAACVERAASRARPAAAIASASCTLLALLAAAGCGSAVWLELTGRRVPTRAIPILLLVALAAALCSSALVISLWVWARDFRSAIARDDPCSVALLLDILAMPTGASLSGLGRQRGSWQPAPAAGAALDRLARLGREDAVWLTPARARQLRRLLMHRSPQVRLQAVRGIAAVRDRRALPAVRALAKASPSDLEEVAVALAADAALVLLLAECEPPGRGD